MTTPDRKRKTPVRSRGLGVHVPAPCSSGKHSWLSRHAAVQAGRKAGGAFGKTFRVYRHGVCGQYHLTTRPAAKRTP